MIKAECNWEINEIVIISDDSENQTQFKKNFVLNENGVVINSDVETSLLLQEILLFFMILVLERLIPVCVGLLIIL